MKKQMIIGIMIVLGLLMGNYVPVARATANADAFDFPFEADGGTRPPSWASYNVQNSSLTDWSPCYGKNMSQLQHAGEDWFRAAGTDVHAIANGRVIYIAAGWDHGDAIVIEHTLQSGWSNPWGSNIIYSVYLHVDRSVSQWDDVSRRQVIGHVHDWPGNSHSHLEVRRYGDMSSILRCPSSGSSSWIGPSYTDSGVNPDIFGYTNPQNWIDNHRGGTPPPPSCLTVTGIFRRMGNQVQIGQIA